MKLGVDLGGSKIETIVLQNDGKEIWRERRSTPSDCYDDIVKCVVDMVLFAEHKTSSQASLGFGIPGHISEKTNLIRNANTVVLNGKPFKSDIEDALNRKVRIENDANCFALSEAIDGAGKGEFCVFGVILGTGCGGGLVFNNAIWHGHNHLGGEWGHNPLPWPTDNEIPGPKCYCGKQGCIETFLSGPGLSDSHKAMTGKKIEAIDIVKSENKKSARSLSLYCDRLARSLASVINLVDPSCIILGGGLSNYESLYKRLPSLIGQYVFSESFDTPIRRNVHGDSSGVRGAAWLWD